VFTVDDVRSAATREPDALFVLAYAEADDAALESEMGQMRPEILRRCESRPMPEFTVGQALGFRTRVCPIVRTRKPGTRPLGVNRHGRVKHREIDAFIHATLIAPEGARVDREAVYVGWLGRELQRHGACSLTAAEVVEFRRERMRRGRASLERPNVVLEGSLSVMDPAAFRALLIRGVGRHRAFGFGMILLRPPGR
jgi:CRISPR system Cascade subunit CasE